MRSDVSLHRTVGVERDARAPGTGVEGDAGAPGTGVDGTEDAQAAEHDVQQITAAFAQFLEHMLLLASSAHVAAEFPVFVFSCWSSSVQEDDMESGCTASALSLHAKNGKTHKYSEYKHLA